VPHNPDLRFIFGIVQDTEELVPVNHCVVDVDFVALVAKADERNNHSAVL
jgi:hypothetical protein